MNLLSRADLNNSFRLLKNTFEQACSVVLTPFSSLHVLFVLQSLCTGVVSRGPSAKVCISKGPTAHCRPFLRNLSMCTTLSTQRNSSIKVVRPFQQRSKYGTQSLQRSVQEVELGKPKKNGFTLGQTACSKLVGKVGFPHLKRKKWVRGEGVWGSDPIFCLVTEIGSQETDLWWRHWNSTLDVVCAASTAKQEACVSCCVTRVVNECSHKPGTPIRASTHPSCLLSCIMTQKKKRMTEDACAV